MHYCRFGITRMLESSSLKWIGWVLLQILQIWVWLPRNGDKTSKQTMLPRSSHFEWVIYELYSRDSHSDPDRKCRSVIMFRELKSFLVNLLSLQLGRWGVVWWEIITLSAWIFFFCGLLWINTRNLTGGTFFRGLINIIFMGKQMRICRYWNPKLCILKVCPSFHLHSSCRYIFGTSFGRIMYLRHRK